jgi:hypothetical protein
MSIGKVTDGVKQSRRETILVLLDPEYNNIANLRNVGKYYQSTWRKIIESLNLNLFLPQFAFCVYLYVCALSFHNFLRYLFGW